MTTDREIKTRINSEIHASLRRLEDADYVNNMVQAESMSALVDQANEANQSLQAQIDSLSSEVYQLHSYIEPHIYQGDLQYFQTAYIGNLQVAQGGSVTGIMTFNSKVKMNGVLEMGANIDATTISVANGLTLDGGFEYDGTTYSPHSLTIEGRTLPGAIFSDQDMSFSLAGLASGSWSGSLSSATFSVKTNTNHVVLGSTTLVPAVHAEYISSSHKYKVWATVIDQNGIKRLESATQYTSDTAYEDGKSDGSSSYPPNSATFEWFETVDGEPHFKRTGGDFFGRTSRTVYWDD